ncbi:STAS domain-containing protein [Mycobacterium sp. URHB0021]|jgi:STAS domain-containing protein
MRAEAPSPLTVTASTEAGATVLAADGVLDSTTYMTLRDAIIKAALAQPCAVIVDVTGLAVPAPSAWAVFTSARWHVGRWPEVPIMLVCAHAAGREAVRRNGITRYVPIYAETDRAVKALSEQDAPPSRRRARARLPASSTSLRRARRVTDEWLTEWSLTEFIPVTRVIVTTFIENVLEHTESAPNLRLETDGTTVTVAVEDTSHAAAGLREEPDCPGRPSGLSIVAALSRVWGNAPNSSGKTVWAVVGPENIL